MEGLKEKIKKDLSFAIKEKDTVASSVLRMLLSSILLKEKDKNYKARREGKATQDVNLSDEEALEVIVFEAKKRRDSISLFEKGKREDLVKKEKEELSVLLKYLPEQMEEDEIKKEIEKIIKGGKKEFKEIMAEIMPKVKGRADGSIVSRIAREILNSC